MGTMVKMYIHVLLVDIHESSLFRKCESNFINETIKCSNAFKLAVVLFSGHSGFDRYAGMTSSCPVYGSETHIKPH